MRIGLEYEIIDELCEIENKCEMSRDQIAFLCGLLKWKKPRKIVEVGVAEGGTTAIIIKCLESMGGYLSSIMLWTFWRGVGMILIKIQAMSLTKYTRICPK